jgi:mannose-1-phosphate guanylyltransferase
MNTIYGLILAGGKGERFWPMSRKRRPKQLLPILGGSPLIKSTFERIRPLISSRKIYIVASRDLAPSITHLLTDWNEKNLFLEPKGLNTAPAIAYAATVIARTDPEATMVVLPADHHISNPSKFLEALKVAALGAQQNLLVTFGIVPTRPERGYGYIEVGKEIRKEVSGSSKRKFPIHRAKGFKEKPNLKQAREFLKRGDFLWNSGIFVWKVQTILDAIKEHLPNLAIAFEKFSTAIGTSEEGKALNKIYNKIGSISIDYGVMERAENVAVIRADFPWDDLGTWSSIPRLKGLDKNGNYIFGNHLGIETRDSTIVSQEGLVATLGISDLLIVRTREVTLITRKNKDQDIKRLVEQLWENEELKKYG